MYEITFIDSGVTVRWSTRKCNSYFGKEEFREIARGYLPHIVAVRI